MARRPYRMTAARRAALRKAQIESAKKRKRRRRFANTTLGVVGVTAAAAGGSYLRQSVNQRRYRKAYKAFFDRPKAITRGKTYVKNRNPLFTTLMVDANGRGRGRAMRPRRVGGVWKVKPNGLPRYVKKPRPEYDAARRNSYDYRARRRSYLQNRTTILENAKIRRRAAQRKQRRNARKGKGK